LGESPTFARFGDTRWSVVLAAAGKPLVPEAAAARETLCQAYWSPLYAYIRRLGHSPHDAQDLTQEFLARFLEKDYLGNVDQSRGRFRSYMLAALKHFLANAWDKQQALKRGGGALVLSIDMNDAETHCRFEPAENETPEVVFQKRWAASLLEGSLARLRREYQAEGKERLFEQLKSTLIETREGVAYAEIAARLQTSEAAVKMAVHRLRQRYRGAIRSEIAATLAVAEPSEVEDELREVLRVYGAG
jgi:RNA polymerase sigma-70 factor (ECF subfamily)